MAIDLLRFFPRNLPLVRCLCKSGQRFGQFTGEMHAIVHLTSGKTSFHQNTHGPPLHKSIQSFDDCEPKDGSGFLEYIYIGRFPCELEFPTKSAANSTLFSKESGCKKTSSVFSVNSQACVLFLRHYVVDVGCITDINTNPTSPFPAV